MEDFISALAPYDCLIFDFDQTIATTNTARTLGDIHWRRNVGRVSLSNLPLLRKLFTEGRPIYICTFHVNEVAIRYLLNRDIFGNDAEEFYLPQHCQIVYGRVDADISAEKMAEWRKYNNGILRGGIEGPFDRVDVTYWRMKQMQIKAIMDKHNRCLLFDDNRQVYAGTDVIYIDPGRQFAAELLPTYTLQIIEMTKGSGGLFSPIELAAMFVLLIISVVVFRWW